MEEVLVSFETAKLAREKGFIYMKANCFGDNMCYQLPDGELINALKGNTVTGYILAPTQSLLQKWLREEHKISIIIDDCFIKHDFIDETKLVFDYTLSSLGKQNYKFSKTFNSYEEALEFGLLQALQMV